MVKLNMEHDFDFGQLVSGLNEQQQQRLCNLFGIAITNATSCEQELNRAYTEADEYRKQQMVDAATNLSKQSADKGHGNMLGKGHDAKSRLGSVVKTISMISRFFVFTAFTNILFYM